MRSIIIDRKGATLGIDKKGIKIDNDEYIPFRLIDLLFVNTKIDSHIKDMLKISKEGISIIFFGDRDSDFYLLTQHINHNGDLKLSQYKAHIYKRLEIAKYILKQKISTHIKHLNSIGFEDSANRWIDKIEQATDIASLMGIEGSFASYYFKQYFLSINPTLHKGTRSKQPPKDPINAMMSYLYTIFYYLITTRLIMRGFEVAIGYLHEPFRSHNALSSDVLEIFRASINQEVANWFGDGILHKRDFTSAKNGGVYLRSDSRRAIWEYIKEFIDSKIPQIDNEIAQIKKMII